MAAAGGIGGPGTGGQLGEAAQGRGHLEVAGIVEAYFIGPGVAQLHLGGVGVGGQQEVVLQVLAGVLVEGQIDAGPQGGVTGAGVAGHMAGPAAAVVAVKVVALVAGGGFAAQGGPGRGPHKRHLQGTGPQRRRGSRGRVRRQARHKGVGKAVVGKEQPPAGHLRYEAGGGVPLPFVGQKGEARCGLRPHLGQGRPAKKTREKKRKPVFHKSNTGGRREKCP